LDWQQRYPRFNQRLNASLVNGAYRENLFETKFGKFINAFFGATGVHLVSSHENWFSALPQARRYFSVQRHDTFLHVDDEDNDVGSFDGQLHLLDGSFDDGVVGLFTAQQANATGVHQREWPPMPLGFGADAVTRDAGLIVNNGNAPPDNAIEQGGLADIRTTNDGDQT